MGNEVSAPSGDAPKSTRLLRYDWGVKKWVAVSASVDPEFLRTAGDVDEDEEDLDGWEGPEVPWHLHVGGLCTKVCDAMNLVDQDTHGVIFIVDGKGAYRIEFAGEDAKRHFLRAYSRKLFENQYSTELSGEADDEVMAEIAKRVGEENVAWYQGQDDGDFEDVWVEDEEATHAAEVEARLKNGTPLSQEGQGSRTVKDEEAEDREQGRNTGLALSAATPLELEMGAGDNSFLLRQGGRIDVMRNSDMALEFRAQVVAKSPQSEGGMLTPNKAILANKERQMLLLSPGQGTPDSSVFQFDLEREAVVTRWNFGDDLNQGARGTPPTICVDSKSAQLSDHSTFLGMSGKRIARYDMRMEKGLAQDFTRTLQLESDKTNKTYSANPGFTCIATAGDGSTVIGSADGTVRCYTDSSLTRAKSNFPGLGDPIICIDVTYDGQWVLAATRTYLMVISTKCRDAKGLETTGFRTRMGAQKAAPRILRMNPVHVPPEGIRFHDAKFSWITESGRAERYIIASTGKMSVIWSFRRVKQANHDPCYSRERNPDGGVLRPLCCTCYRMQVEGGDVRAEGFMHDNWTGQSETVVVATDNETTYYKT